MLKRKNNKGQIFIFTFMLGVTIIILALAFAPGLSSHIADIRSPTDNFTGLDCGNTSISTFDQATCVVTDISGFYIIGGMIAIAGAIIGARLVLK